jgi:hypothetical protein
MKKDSSPSLKKHIHAKIVDKQESLCSYRRLNWSLQIRKESKALLLSESASAQQ